MSSKCSLSINMWCDNILFSFLWIMVLLVGPSNKVSAAPIPCIHLGWPFSLKTAATPATISIVTSAPPTIPTQRLVERMKKLEKILWPTEEKESNHSKIENMNHYEIETKTKEPVIAKSQPSKINPFEELFTNYMKFMRSIISF